MIFEKFECLIFILIIFLIFKLRKKNKDDCWDVIFLIASVQLSYANIKSISKFKINFYLTNYVENGYPNPKIFLKIYQHDFLIDFFYFMSETK